MQLTITHVTAYDYDEPVHYALQKLRLIPRTGHGQNVLEWETTIVGGEKQLMFDDLFVNHTELVKVNSGATRIEITSRGVVEVEDRSGVIGQHAGFAPLWLFQDATPMTAAGNKVRQLAARVRAEAEDADDVTTLHHLSRKILSLVKYETGRTTSDTPPKWRCRPGTASARTTATS